MEDYNINSTEENMQEMDTVATEVQNPSEEIPVNANPEDEGLTEEIKSEEGPEENEAAENQDDSEQETQRAEDVPAADEVEEPSDAAPVRKRRRIVIDSSDYSLIREGAKDLSYYERAFRRKRRLTGIVTGTQIIKGLGNCAIVQEYNEREEVNIPASLFVPPARQESVNNNDRSDTIDDLIRYYVGAEVDFFLREIRDNNIMIGDRISAMKDKAEHYYLKRPDQDFPIIMPGDEAIGRIVTVANGSARIEVFGIETFVSIRDMSYTMIGTVRDSFTPGMRIPVLIESVNTDGENYSLTVSPREVNKKRLQARLSNKKLYSPGTRVLGKVTAIRENGVYGHFISDGVPFYCPFPDNGKIPEVEDKVIVNIFRIEDTTVMGRLVTIEQKSELKY